MTGVCGRFWQSQGGKNKRDHEVDLVTRDLVNRWGRFGEHRDEGDAGGNEDGHGHLLVASDVLVSCRAV